MRRSSFFTYLAVVFGMPAILFALVAGALISSAALRADLLKPGLLGLLTGNNPMVGMMSRMSQLQMRQALPLVMMLNQADFTGPAGQAEAREVLIRLCVISGRDFGTGFKGNVREFTWNEPQDPEAWSRTLIAVNAWSDATFGASFPGMMQEYRDHPEAFPGDTADYSSQEEWTPPASEEPEPPPTYEPPPDNEPSLRYDGPELPPPPENNDNGQVIDPDYHGNDSNYYNNNNDGQ